MPKVALFDAHYNGEITLGDTVLEKFKNENVKKIALFASVQFLHLDKVRKQLNEAGIVVLNTKARRTHVETQVLGCDAYDDSYAQPITDEADAILYIGDGLFHPKAVLLAQRSKEVVKDVITWNPMTEQMIVLTKADIDKQVRKQKANLKRYFAAETVGLLITTKPGQEHFKPALLLKEKIEAQGKEVYMFVANNIPVFQLEDFPFIKAWVNTACVRIGLDDITNIPQCLINLKEALDPVKALENIEKY